MNYSDIKELLKDAKDIATGANDLQLKSKLLDIQSAVYDLQDENRELRLRVNELENIDIQEQDLEFYGGVYLRKKDNRKVCSKCWDSEQKLISTSKIDEGMFFCPVCKAYRIYDKDSE